MAVDLDKLAHRARERMEPSWNELREQRVLAAVRRAPPWQSRGARIGPWLTASAAVAVLFLVGVIAWPGEGAMDEPLSRLELEDGSVCVLESGARLSASERSRELIRLVQRNGRVRYDVSHRPERTFEVLAEPVTVRVRGTRFVVDVSRDIVTVAVEDGRVEVRARERVTELTEGEALSVPRRRSGPRRVEESEADAPSEASPGARSEPALETRSEDETSRTPETPVVEAESVEHHAAPVDELEQSARETRKRRRAQRPSRRTPEPKDESESSLPEKTISAAPTSDPAELLARADAHRRAGEDREAIAVLERFVREHSGDVRAASAAFTLGRLRRQLGEHAAAAEAFARAYASAPDGPLAEDSLAYEALSWAAAGRNAQASRTARLYLERYPDGLHARTLGPLSEL